MVLEASSSARQIIALLRLHCREWPGNEEIKPEDKDSTKFTFLSLFFCASSENQIFHGKYIFAREIFSGPENQQIKLSSRKKITVRWTCLITGLHCRSRKINSQHACHVTVHAFVYYQHWLSARYAPGQLRDFCQEKRRPCTRNTFFLEHPYRFSEFKSSIKICFSVNKVDSCWRRWS